MKNKKYCERFNSANNNDEVLDPVEVENAKKNALRKPSQELLEYYKKKASIYEKEFDSLSELLDNIKSVCDLGSELQAELSLKNEEVSRLQQVVSDLQIELFREKEYCVKVTAENDKLRIQELEDKKKINALLMITGAAESEIIHMVSLNSKGVYVERKLPPKLQKLREEKLSKAQGPSSNSSNKKEAVDKSEEIDPQILILKNHSLASQLEHHIHISREQIRALLKDKELVREEREIERKRLQKEIGVLSAKLKQTQDILCETTSKLLKCQQNFDKEKTAWMEEKDKFIRALKALREKHNEKYPDIVGYAVSGVGGKKIRACAETEYMKEQILEKEQLAASYREQIVAMEAEINRLRERAQICRNTFKEKMDKMTAQTAYLKNKYEDLDRRRQLEAEGFRTDIRMLRERLKELEKKLSKANLCNSVQPSEQHLLISARNTLNRAKQLEKELINMKSKFSNIDKIESS